MFRPGNSERNVFCHFQFFFDPVPPPKLSKIGLFFPAVNRFQERILNFSKNYVSLGNAGFVYSILPTVFVTFNLITTQQRWRNQMEVSYEQFEIRLAYHFDRN